MKRTILEVTCDRCGVIQRFELTSNHGERLAATVNVGAMLDRHQWGEQRIEGGSQFLNEDICRACSGKMFH